LTATHAHADLCGRRGSRRRRSGTTLCGGFHRVGDAGAAQRRSRELGCERLDGFDVGRRREQLVGFLHEGCGDRSVEVGLAALGAGDDVEDAERGVVQLDREPGLVSGSPSAKGRAEARKAASSSWLPGLAASVASSPTVTMAISSRRARRLVPKTRPYLRIGT
jgi:hypothetical protein